MIVFVEYDPNGELVHVCEVHTAEGKDVAQPAPGMTPPQKVQHAQAVAAAIAQREAATRAELQGHTNSGKPLLVLPDGTPTPQHGRHHVVNGQLVQRTDAEYAAWQQAQQGPTTP